MIIYYNPDCSKCREAYALLENAGCNINLRNYLQDPPSVEELKSLLALLGLKAENLVRRGESLYIEKFSGRSYSEEEWLQILIANPVLIERPVVIDGNKAVIGRPPVKVLSLIS